jgi:hypothetical protein
MPSKLLRFQLTRRRAGGAEVCDQCTFDCMEGPYSIVMRRAS